MRIYEIASAEDQIALFKLITDKVWQALGDQQRADAQAKAAQPLKAKLKPKVPVRTQFAKRFPAAKPKVPQPPKPSASQSRPTLQQRLDTQQLIPLTKQFNAQRLSNGSKTQNFDSESDAD